MGKPAQDPSIWATQRHASATIDSLFPRVANRNRVTRPERYIFSSTQAAEQIP